MASRSAAPTYVDGSHNRGLSAGLGRVLDAFLGCPVLHRRRQMSLKLCRPKSGEPEKQSRFKNIGVPVNLPVKSGLG